MATTARPPRQGLLGGVLVTLFAEGIALPAGLITAIVLTRGLGPEVYGRFTVVGTTVAITEWLLIAVLARPVVKFVAEADDWRPVAATSFRVYVISGLAIGAGFWVLAGWVAAALRDPLLAGYFRLFAAEIPIFAAGAACRNVLAGQARYRQSAIASGLGWTARVTFIVLFVSLGGGIQGAILGSIAGTLAGAVASLLLTGSAVWGRAGFPTRDLMQLALPAFIAMLSSRLVDQVGILALERLAEQEAEVGYYGAAMNVLMVTGVIAAAVTPVLISTLTNARHRRDDATVLTVSSGAIRFGLALLAMAAVIAGSAREVVALLFGPAFEPASPLLALLVVAALARSISVIVAAILIALGHAWSAALVAAPLPVLALLAHTVLIPRLGAVGAAAVTVTVALLGATASVLVGCRIVGLTVPLGTLARSAVFGVAAFALAAVWPGSGILVVLKVAVLGAAVAAAFFVSGELSREELSSLRAALPGARA